VVVGSSTATEEVENTTAGGGTTRVGSGSFTVWVGMGRMVGGVMAITGVAVG